MKKVYFMLRAMLLIALLTGVSATAGEPPPCVDINADGNCSIIDVAQLIDGMYVTGNLDTAYAARAAGIDGYEGVTSNDLMSLLGWLFINFDADPYCNTSLGSDYATSDDTLKFADLLVPAGADTCVVDVLVNALNEFYSLALTFEYGLGGDDIEYVGIEWLEPADLCEFDLHDGAANLLSLSMVNLFDHSDVGCIPQMNSYTPIARLTFVVTPSSEDREISITPTEWNRENTRHITLVSRLAADTTFIGLVPVIETFADNPDEDAWGNLCFGGVRGNIDGDWEQIVDISDLQTLIDYEFLTFKEPMALGEADVAPLTGADGIIDISDVSVMVDHLFISLAELPTCTECAQAKMVPREAGSLSVLHENGTTVIELNAAEELRGLQIELRGDNAALSATSPLEGQMDLLVGRHDGDVMIGLIDLNGPATIPVGDSRVVELNGTYDVVSATATSMEHVSLALNLGTEAQVPGSFSLSQNYPNPFNPSTDIIFSIPVRGHVELSVYNSLGQRVATLVDGVREAGEQTVTWNGTDQSGNSVASGVYFYRLKADGFSGSKKMLLLK